MHLHASYKLSRILTCMAAAVLITGCSTAHYKESADKEVYQIIQQKQMQALGIKKDFTIEREQAEPLLGQPLQETEAIANLPSEEAVFLTLPQALKIACSNSREYQSRKEDVYLSALDYTMALYRWGPIFSGSASTRYENSPGDETVGGGTNFGLTKMLADGTSIGLKLTSDVLVHLIDNPREAAASLLTATITKPLWRGAGQRIAQENLRQASQNVVYSIRSFARYRKTFSVNVAADYYRVLQQRDAVINAWSNYQNLIQARDRTEMMADAGRLPEFQVHQAQQDELRAEDNYVQAVQSYKQSLDQFKILLGLTTDSPVVLDPKELELLREKGINHPDVAAEDAVKIALRARLDYATTLDQVTDAGRKVAVAENGLAPDVNLVLASSNPTGDNRPYAFRTGLGTYSAGLDMEIPLDRKSERNTYRRALISLDRSKRDAELQRDEVKLQVRQAWRRLQEAQASYNIQKLSLALAQSRVESTTLLLQAGRASTRDVLEAQDALLQAQNSLTRTLIDHTVSRLEFWRDIGILKVNDDGLWQDNYDINQDDDSAAPADDQQELPDNAQ